MGLAQVVNVSQREVEQFNEFGDLLARVVQLEMELSKSRELLADASEALEFYAEGANVIVCEPSTSEANLLIENGYNVGVDGTTYIENGEYAQRIFDRIAKIL